MNPARIRRFSLIPVLGLAAAVLCGCPAKPSCPNCYFRTATFSVNAADLEGLTSATMETHIEHHAEECPRTGCVTDRSDDITCKLRGGSAGEKRQMLPVASGERATHRVEIKIQTSAGPRDDIHASVGEPTSETEPPLPICR